LFGFHFWSPPTFFRDAIIHIPKKEFLLGKAFCVLHPGGWFAASDWLMSHDDAPTSELATFLAMEDFGDSMVVYF
jgi:hypothetical protein